ncbi:MAG: hypothetical protein QOI95_1144 [Acidimicrobiaceae bacterium]|jgi:hypothetical protein
MGGSRLERLVPLAGALFGVLMVVGVLAAGEPLGTDASAEEVIKHYDNGKFFIGVITLGLGAVLFMFFAASLRRHLAATGPEWLATTVFGGGIVFTVGLAGFASSQFALLDAADQKALGAAQALNFVDNNNFPPAVIGVCVLLLATAWHVLSSGSLPRWIGWVSLVLGILALAGPLGILAFLLFAPWTFIVAILLYRRCNAGVSPAAAS